MFKSAKVSVKPTSISSDTVYLKEKENDKAKNERLKKFDRAQTALALLDALKDFHLKDNKKVVAGN